MCSLTYQGMGRGVSNVSRGTTDCHRYSTSRWAAYAGDVRTMNQHHGSWMDRGEQMCKLSVHCMTCTHFNTCHCARDCTLLLSKCRLKGLGFAVQCLLGGCRSACLLAWRWCGDPGGCHLTLPCLRCAKAAWRNSVRSTAAEFTAAELILEGGHRGLTLAQLPLTLAQCTKGELRPECQGG